MTSTGFGVVGCGFFGRLLARHLSVTPGARLIAVTDLDRGAAAALAAELGCATEADAQHLADRADIDVVVVATPNHAHLEPVLTSIAAGKHVFVEKPMALTTADCRRMQTAAADAGVTLLVGHIIRLFPAVAEIRRAIERGEIGRPVAARAARARWLDLAGLPANWWKLDRARSGGELVHEIHELDLLCWLLGDVASVFARAANLAHPEVPNQDDVIQLSLEFASGALATLEIGTAYRRPEWSCWVSGAEGAYALDLRAGTLTAFAADGTTRLRGVFDDESANESLRGTAQVPKKQAYNTASVAPARWMDHAVELEVANLVAHFQDGAPTPLAEAVERAVVVAEAAEESARRGEIVQVGVSIGGSVAR